MTTNAEIIAIVERISTMDLRQADGQELEAVLRDLAAVRRWLDGLEAQFNAALARELRRHPRPLATTIRKGRAR